MGDPQSPPQRARELILTVIYKIRLRNFATLFLYFYYCYRVDKRWMVRQKDCMNPSRTRNRWLFSGLTPCEHLDIFHNLLVEIVRRFFSGGINTQVIDILADVSTCFQACFDIHSHVLHRDTRPLCQVD